VTDPGEQGGDRAAKICVADGRGELGSGVSVTLISGLGDLDLGLGQSLCGGGLDGTTSTTWDRLLMSMLIMFKVL
jgi:hypothetical protein